MTKVSRNSFICWVLFLCSTFTICREHCSKPMKKFTHSKLCGRNTSLVVFAQTITIHQWCESRVLQQMKQILFALWFSRENGRHYIQIEAITLLHYWGVHWLQMKTATFSTVTCWVITHFLCFYKSISSSILFTVQGQRWARAKKAIYRNANKIGTNKNFCVLNPHKKLMFAKPFRPIAFLPDSFGFIVGKNSNFSYKPNFACWKLDRRTWSLKYCLQLPLTFIYDLLNYNFTILISHAIHIRWETNFPLILQNLSS